MSEIFEDEIREFRPSDDCAPVIVIIVGRDAYSVLQAKKLITGAPHTRALASTLIDSIWTRVDVEQQPMTLQRALYELENDTAPLLNIPVKQVTP